jgi:hypothetical protein
MTRKGTTNEPTKLTEDLVKRVCANVRIGVHPITACIAEGISQSTFYNWKVKGEQGVEPFASDFWKPITRAEAESEITLVGRAQRGDEPGVGYGESKGALELIQLRFPKRWSRQVKVEVLDQMNRLLDACQRVLAPADFVKVLEAVTGDPGEGETPGDSPEQSPPVH